MAKERRTIREKVVYKCNSRHCKGDGFHKEDDMEEIVLVLKVGKGCPLDFEEVARNEVVKIVERPAVTETPAAVPSDGVMTPRGHAQHMNAGGFVPPPQPNPGMPVHTQEGGGRRSPVSPILADLARRGLQMNPPPDQRILP